MPRARVRFRRPKRMHRIQAHLLSSFFFKRFKFILAYSDWPTLILTQDLWINRRRFGARTSRRRLESDTCSEARRTRPARGARRTAIVIRNMLFICDRDPITSSAECWPCRTQSDWIPFSLNRAFPEFDYKIFRISG